MRAVGFWSAFVILPWSPFIGAGLYFFGVPDVGAVYDFVINSPVLRQVVSWVAMMIMVVFVSILTRPKETVIRL